MSYSSIERLELPFSVKDIYSDPDLSINSTCSKMTFVISESYYVIGAQVVSDMSDNDNSSDNKTYSPPENPYPYVR